jgi:hypothetical protein
MNRHTRKLHRAICALDEKEIRRLAPREFAPSSPSVFWKAIHKARAALLMATPEQREESLRWLQSNGSAPYGEAFNAGQRGLDA